VSYLGSQVISSGTIRSERFSGNSSDTDFVLSYAHSNEASLLIFVSGTKQDASSYTISSGLLQFSSPPATGTNNIEVIYLNGPILQYYVTDGSIGTAQLANNSVTNDKVEFTYSSSTQTANGSGQTFTVTDGTTANSAIVTYNGIILLPVTDYDISGTTLTTTFTPVAGSEISVRYLPV